MTTLGAKRQGLAGSGRLALENLLVESCHSDAECAFWPQHLTQATSDPLSARVRLLVWTAPDGIDVPE